jgi:hypothetical protein
MTIIIIPTQVIIEVEVKWSIKSLPRTSHKAKVMVKVMRLG